VECGKKEPIISPNLVMELTLRDFNKKEVKIDYITGNRVLRTVVFEIDEECTVGEWKSGFAQAAGAKNFYLCRVERSDIIQAFNAEAEVDSQEFNSQ
jgi:hypothetical protein